MSRRTRPRSDPAAHVETHAGIGRLAHRVVHDRPRRADRVLRPAGLPRRLPPTVDLRASIGPVWNQGPLNSCTAHAVAGLVVVVRRREGLDRSFEPSRLFLYYNERALDGDVDTNAPASIRDALRAVERHGACDEPAWPYDPSKLTTRPPQSAYRAAAPHRGLAPHVVDHRLRAMRACLFAGLPFTITLSTFPSLNSDEARTTGAIPQPDRRRERPVGAHALLVMGYDDRRRRFTVRNSWGETWGDKGYGTIPYAYAVDPSLAGSLWTAFRAT